MPKFRIDYRENVPTYEEIEAETPEEAVAKLPRVVHCAKECLEIKNVREVHTYDVFFKLTIGYVAHVEALSENHAREIVLESYAAPKDESYDAPKNGFLLDFPEVQEIRLVD